MNNLIDKVIQWHRDRNLIDGSDDKSQVLKLLQELGELSDSVCQEQDIQDDIGDMLVVMINICERNNVTLGDCLTTAYRDIEHRTGRMVDGVFVKKSA
jgi:NTP pyrophosphatase (non-canonical NTP hydrolase)